MAIVPIVIGASNSQGTVYLYGDPAAGTVAVGPLPKLGDGSVWGDPGEPSGAGLLFQLQTTSKGTKTFLQAQADGTVALTGSQSDDGTHWLAIPVHGAKTFKIFSTGGKQDGKYLALTGDTLGFVDGIDSGTVWTIAPAIDLDALGGLISQYGPIIYHDTAEQYKMCSVEWFLDKATLYDKKTGTSIKSPSVDQLPATLDPDDKTRYSLNLDPSAKPGAPETARAYVHALVGFDHIDLQFWRFYAYNGPGTCWVKQTFIAGGASGSASLAPLGEHWGDWELVVIRIDTATQQPIGVWLSQHNSGIWYGKDQLGQLQKEGDKFVFYASRNGHATYAGTGNNPSEVHDYGALLWKLHFELWNTTSKGDRFDCGADAAIIATDLVDWAPPVPNWVNYPYRWGPVDTSSSITPESVDQLLYAILGPLGVFAGGLGFGYMAATLASFFKQDDINGPEGPITKTATWAGAYS